MDLEFDKQTSAEGSMLCWGDILFQYIRSLIINRTIWTKYA